MGNKFSLNIRLDHGDKPIIAGTTLKGNVTLKVKRKIDTSELSLHLIGTETTIVYRTRNSPKEEKNIAKAVMILNDSIDRYNRSRNKISRGTYPIPFEFVLPSSLPASTQFPKSHTKAFNGRIKYVLQAKLAGIVEEREFFIDSAPLPQDVVPCIAQPTTHELKSFGLLNKGFLSVGASVENSRVGRGRALKVSVASRNDASVDVHRVRVKLVELIDYHALDERASMKIELGKLKDVDLPGLDKTKANSMEVRRSIRMGFERNIESTYQAIYRDLVAADNQIEVIVPETARDTYDGNLMTVSHYLKVTFFTKALVENPSTKIPIVIGNPGNPEQRSQRQQQQQQQQPSPQPSSRERNRDEPIATVIVDSELNLPSNQSQVEVGYRASTAEEGDDDANAPMVDAILLDEEDNPRGPNNDGDDNNNIDETATIVVGSDNVILCGIDDDDETLEVMPPPNTAGSSNPSAPEEYLLRHHQTTTTTTTTAPTTSGGIGHQQNDDVVFRSPPGSPQRHFPSSSQQSQQVEGGGSYSPYQMYNQPQRRINPDYSYDDSDYTSAVSENEHRSPRDQGLLDRLVQELNGSIHDYEVIATKLRNSNNNAGYQEIFQTLTPREFGRIIQNVSMNHQVRVGCLLAKQIGGCGTNNDRRSNQRSSSEESAFICAHCAAGVKSTSEYFRSNMVEALLPFCSDFHSNRRVIEETLSEWELIITQHAFHDAETGRI